MPEYNPDKLFHFCFCTV